LLLGKVWSYYSNVLFELLLGDKQIFFPGRRGGDVTNSLLLGDETDSKGSS